MKENYLFVVIIAITFLITLGGVIAYESSVDESLINVFSQSMSSEYYTNFHNLEFKIPKGFNVTKNNSNDVIMVTKDTKFRNLSSSYTGFELPKNKDIGAISISHISKDNFNNSDNVFGNNGVNFNSTNSSLNSNLNNSNSSHISNSNFNTNSSTNPNVSNDTSSNIDSKDFDNNIDFSKISVTNPSNNLTVDGVTIFRMSKSGVNSYIFSYENGIYAISFYSANSTNSSETDTIFKSIVDRTFKK